MKKFFIVAALVGSVGCIGWSKNDTHHYSLYISPDFTADQANQIADAANEWQYSMDNFITFDGAGIENAPNTINIYPATEKELKCLGITWYDTHEKIQIAVDNDTFATTARHEIGHAIGAKHIGPGNVMCADSGCAGSHITCEDVRDVCEAWGLWNCVADNMSACQVSHSTSE